MFESARKKFKYRFKNIRICVNGALKKAPLSLQRMGAREALGKMLIYYCYVTRENGLILSCTSSLVGRWTGR